MPKELIECYQQRTPARLMVVYGLTEGTGSITYSDPDADVETLSTTIGRPDPELNVRLIKSDGQPCSIGEEGEVQVCHPSVMAGYFNRPQATSATFTADGYLRTGDVALLLPDGNLRLVGRLKEMYKSGGYNIYPREIELCLESHPDVALAAVIGMPDPLYQEVGHAFVLPQPGHAPTATDLLAWCRSHLANYKVPKTITVAAHLPMLPVGKIDKQALKAQSTTRTNDS
jgi:fatty-acyl-CoA synthase